MMDKRTFTRIMSLLISRKDISNIKLSTTTTQKRILSINIYCDGVKTEQDPDVFCSFLFYHIQVQAYIQQLVNEPAPTKCIFLRRSTSSQPMLFSAPSSMLLWNCQSRSFWCQCYSLNSIHFLSFVTPSSFPDYYQSKSDRCFSVYHYINAFTLYQLVCLFGV